MAALSTCFDQDWRRCLAYESATTASWRPAAGYGGESRYIPGSAVLSRCTGAEDGHLAWCLLLAMGAMRAWYPDSLALQARGGGSTSLTRAPGEAFRCRSGPRSFSGEIPSAESLQWQLSRKQAERRCHHFGRGMGPRGVAPFPRARTGCHPRPLTTPGSQDTGDVAIPSICTVRPPGPTHARPGIKCWKMSRQAP